MQTTSTESLALALRRGSRPAPGVSGRGGGEEPGSGRGGAGRTEERALRKPLRGAGREGKWTHTLQGGTKLYEAHALATTG